jgi:tetratricopeptide (TPR) repeat protein
MSGRECLWILTLLALGQPAFADPPATVQAHVSQGHISILLTEYQRAIDEFGQAYRQEQKARYLYWIAQCYERVASLPTKTPPESLESKQRALSIYERFIETAPPMEPGLEIARGRIAPLRQEINDLTGQIAEQGASLKSIQSDIKQLVVEVRALRELILRWMRGERAGTPTTFAR